MYLLESTTLELRHFVNGKGINYAILSHRWGDGEVLFEDTNDLTKCSKPGIVKVTGICDIAKQKKIQWVWIDTCCIDKKSSAELSEAINSMYEYYRDAVLCVAYLNDVTSTIKEQSFEGQFSKSEWFKRSWTLQELLAPAPTSFVFYNHGWLELADKQGIADLVSQITNIDAVVLRGANISGYSIAERMSWAANRVATRDEDLAYSLMGIFDINMPMLYGEGLKAFQRLQEEILKKSDDETIFAWDDSEHTTSPLTGSLLAPHPRAFINCHFLKDTVIVPRRRAPISTSRGIEFECWLKEMKALRYHVYSPSQNGVSVALLNASFRIPERPETFVGVYLQSLASTPSSFIRVAVNVGAKIRHRWEGSLIPYFPQRGITVLVTGDNRVRYQVESSFDFSFSDILASTNKTEIRQFKAHGAPEFHFPPVLPFNWKLNENQYAQVFKNTSFSLLAVPKRYVKLAAGLRWACNPDGQAMPRIEMISNKYSGPICNMYWKDSTGHIALLHVGITLESDLAFIVIGDELIKLCDQNMGNARKSNKCKQSTLAQPHQAHVQDLLTFRPDYPNVSWASLDCIKGKNQSFLEPTLTQDQWKTLFDNAPNTDPDKKHVSAQEERLWLGCRSVNDRGYEGYCAIRHSNSTYKLPGSSVRRYFYHFLDKGESHTLNLQTGYSLQLLDARVDNKVSWSISLWRWSQPEILAVVRAKMVESINEDARGYHHLVRFLKSLIAGSIDRIWAESGLTEESLHFWVNL